MDIKHFYQKNKTFFIFIYVLKLLSSDDILLSYIILQTQAPNNTKIKAFGMLLLLLFYIKRYPWLFNCLPFTYLGSWQSYIWHLANVLAFGISWLFLLLQPNDKDSKCRKKNCTFHLLVQI